MDANATQDVIQHVLTQTFAELGATGSVVRTILLRENYYAGQRIRCDGVQAVILAGGMVVDFYDETCGLLKTVSLEESDKEMAA